MGKKHRIFIAINLPENIKKELGEYKDKWPELPAKWTKPENIHITLAFIGYLNEEGILEIQNTVNKVAKNYKPFLINLTKISYGPPKTTPPRMVWAIAEKSEEYISLCDSLKKALLALPKISFKPENRETVPHITLARIKEWEWRRIEPEERPEIEESINSSFQVNSIDLMESVLKREGPAYTILKSFNL
jgi:2'-5' RNA ligase